MWPGTLLWTSIYKEDIMSDYTSAVQMRVQCHCCPGGVDQCSVLACNLMSWGGAGHQPRLVLAVDLHSRFLKQESHVCLIAVFCVHAVTFLTPFMFQCKNEESLCEANSAVSTLGSAPEPSFGTGLWSLGTLQFASLATRSESRQGLQRSAHRLYVFLRLQYLIVCHSSK